MINTLRAFPTLPAVVVAPGVDLVRQLYDDITGPRGIKGRDVSLICTGSGKKAYQAVNGITVCSADSLDKLDYSLPRLVLADEPHALVTDNRLEKINNFTRARRYGYGATLKGRFDQKDALITGVFGPVLANRTYTEAVKEGAICPITVLFVRVEISPVHYKDRNVAYRNILFLNPTMAEYVAQICRDVIPADFQTLIFIKQENQADLYLEHIGTEHALAMAKRMNSSERKELTARMNDQSNPITRCLCTKIFIQGVTFHDLRVLINVEGGGNNTGAIQKPGRLAEIRPGKKRGIMIDFLFEPPYDYGKNPEGPWAAPIKDSRNRMKAYKEIGYDIIEVDTIEELKEQFDKLV